MALLGDVLISNGFGFDVQGRQRKPTMVRKTVEGINEEMTGRYARVVKQVSVCFDMSDAYLFNTAVKRDVLFIYKITKPIELRLDNKYSVFIEPCVRAGFQRGTETAYSDFYVYLSAVQEDGSLEHIGNYLVYDYVDVKYNNTLDVMDLSKTPLTVCTEKAEQKKDKDKDKDKDTSVDIEIIFFAMQSLFLMSASTQEVKMVDGVCNYRVQDVLMQKNLSRVTVPDFCTISLSKTVCDIYLRHLYERCFQVTYLENPEITCGTPACPFQYPHDSTKLHKVKYNGSLPTYRLNKEQFRCLYLWNSVLCNNLGTEFSFLCQDFKTDFGVEIDFGEDRRVVIQYRKIGAKLHTGKYEGYKVQIAPIVGIFMYDCASDKTSTVFLGTLDMYCCSKENEQYCGLTGSAEVDASKIFYGEITYLHLHLLLHYMFWGIQQEEVQALFSANQITQTVKIEGKNVSKKKKRQTSNTAKTREYDVIQYTSDADFKVLLKEDYTVLIDTVLFTLFPRDDQQACDFLNAYVKDWNIGLDSAVVLENPNYKQKGQGIAVGAFKYYVDQPSEKGWFDMMGQFKEGFVECFFSLKGVPTIPALHYTAGQRLDSDIQEVRKVFNNGGYVRVDAHASAQKKFAEEYDMLVSNAPVLDYKEQKDSVLKGFVLMLAKLTESMPSTPMSEDLQKFFSVEYDVCRAFDISASSFHKDWRTLVEFVAPKGSIRKQTLLQASVKEILSKMDAEVVPPSENEKSVEVREPLSECGVEVQEKPVTEDDAPIDTQETSSEGVKEKEDGSVTVKGYTRLVNGKLCYVSSYKRRKEG